MQIQTSTFNILDKNIECLQIKLIGHFSNTNANELRETITPFMNDLHHVIYINTVDVDHIHLSYINEIIHTNYIMTKADKQLVLVYKKNSTIDKWVVTTGLDRFMDTAIVQ